MQQPDRLLLDIPNNQDFESFFDIHSDPQTNLFNPNGPLNLEKSGEAFDILLKHWNDHGFGRRTIKLKNAPHTVVGYGGLSYSLYGNELKLNLGYRFDRRFWGQGFATELSQLAIRFGFGELKADNIFALVRPNHTVSIKVLEKCNMVLCGTLDDVPNEAQSLVYRIEKQRFHQQHNATGNH